MLKVLPLGKWSVGGTGGTQILLTEYNNTILTVAGIICIETLRKVIMYLVQEGGARGSNSLTK